MQSALFVRSLSVRPEALADDSYISAIPAVRALTESPIELRAPVCFLIGENGSGKSTLMEALAVQLGFNPEGGTRNFNFSTRDTHSPLSRYLRVSRGARYPRDGYFLRAESFYNVASYIDDLDQEGSGPRLTDSYGGRSLHGQSHGESFLALVLHRLGDNGLYLLDEPEAALSPARQLALLSAMHDLVESGSQMIIATHSPILMAYPGADLFQLDERGVAPVDYRDTEHYQITRRFLENPEGMMRYLFEK